MQLITETYGIMRDGFGMTADACGDEFTRWNDGALRSYLIEISGKVARATDPDSGTPMLGAPVSDIEAAVARSRTPGGDALSEDDLRDAPTAGKIL